MMRMRLGLLAAVLLFPVIAFAQGSYKQPPKEIMDVLNAPATPSTSVSPARDKIALLLPLRYPPISELAQPMLRLAGTRVNPNNNAPHLQGYSVAMTLKNIADGKETPVNLPTGAKISSPQWSPDGRYIAFGNITASGVELWFVDTTTAKASKVKNVLLNTAFGGYGWEGSTHLSATVIPSGRGPAPAYQNVVPTEPSTCRFNFWANRASDGISHKPAIIPKRRLENCFFIRKQVFLLKK